MRPIIAASIAAVAIATGALAYAQTATQPGIVLTWEHPAPHTVTHYWVERSTRTDFQDYYRFGPVEETTYLDRPGKTGRYYYRIYAEGPGGLSAPSDYVQISVQLPPEPPINVGIKQEN